MQNLSTQQVISFFKEVKSVDKDGDGGYIDQPWFKHPDGTADWIPVEVDICYTDPEDQMLMGRVEQMGDVEEVIKNLPIGAVIVHPIYTPGKGILAEELYTLTESGWVKTTVIGNDML